MIGMRLTVEEQVSNNSRQAIVHSSNRSIGGHPRKSSFPSINLNVVCSPISTRVCMSLRLIRLKATTNC